VVRKAINQKEDGIVTNMYFVDEYIVSFVGLGNSQNTAIVL
jgi:hypothetical protein